MTIQEKLVKKKMSVMELASYLKNVSEACRVMGVSRQHFYDIKQAYAEGGLEALQERSRRVARPKNRVSEEIENAIVSLAEQQPAYGQKRVANELRATGKQISDGGVRSVWARHGLETMKKRLARLEEKVAKEGVILTESQLAALEKAERNRVVSVEEVETHHPGYLLGQDTFYVGCLKGVGRIYQQTVIDTYSSVTFAKLYTDKGPIGAADILNDRVLPFFEQHEVPVMRVLTDRGTEFCGREEQHPYELFLGLQDIEHSRTKAQHPQTNGICERVQQTILNEFYRVAFRKKIYETLDQLQADLDAWMVTYNHERTHQGKRCLGRTPMTTFLDGLKVVKEKMLPQELPAVA